MINKTIKNKENKNGSVVKEQIDSKRDVYF